MIYEQHYFKCSFQLIPLYQFVYYNVVKKAFINKLQTLFELKQKQVKFKY